jgi:transcriptional regulator GlxA family with amidase domain
MKLRRVLWGLLGVLVLFGAGFGVWVAQLPPAPVTATAPPIPQQEANAALVELKPKKRERPLIAIVSINDATEVTDYLMPYGILKRADIADVVALATEKGPVSLYPALKVEPDETIAEFDAKNPEGADYVIVPAMSRDDDVAVMQWLKHQSAKGAVIIGVCAGAKVVAAAGLLDGKRATTHWYFLSELRRENPGVVYVEDRRIVVDRGVATTTGITASMPMSLTLIEAIAGRDKAEAVARDLGLEKWDARHDSNAFRFNRPFAITAMRNLGAFWNWEKLGIELTEGMDEVALALVADSWSRTYRSRAVTFARSADAQITKSGLRIVPDEVTSAWPADARVPAFNKKPAVALDETLHAIANRYGKKTAAFVAMQLEYPADRQFAGKAPVESVAR